MSEYCQEWGCESPTSSTSPDRCLYHEREHNKAKKRPKKPDRIKSLSIKLGKAEAERNCLRSDVTNLQMDLAAVQAVLARANRINYRLKRELALTKRAVECKDQAHGMAIDREFTAVDKLEKANAELDEMKRIFHICDDHELFDDLFELNCPICAKFEDSAKILVLEKELQAYKEKEEKDG